MAKMNKNEMKVKAKELLVEQYPEIFSEDNRVLVGADATSRDYKYAYPVQVEGETLYVVATLTTPQFWDTEKVKAFNFEESHEAYLEDKDFQAAKAEADKKAKEERAKLKEAKNKK